MQLLHRRDAACERTVQVDVVRVDHIAHAHFRSHGLRAFVHAARDADVGMFIDDAACEVHAGGIDLRHRQAFLWEEAGRAELWPHGDDAALPDADVGVRQGALRTVAPHRGVAENDRLGVGQLGAAEGVHGVPHLARGQRKDAVQSRKRIFFLHRAPAVGALPYRAPGEPFTGGALGLSIPDAAPVVDHAVQPDRTRKAQFFPLEPERDHRPRDGQDGLFPRGVGPGAAYFGYRLFGRPLHAELEDHGAKVQVEGAARILVLQRL